MTPLEIARNCAQGFDFNPALATLLEGGRINRNYQVDAPEGTRLLRLYPPGRSKHQVDYEMHVLKHLAIQACRVPSPLSNEAGHFVLNVDAAVAVWMEFLPAKALGDREAFELSPNALARLLDPVFSALESFQPPFSKTLETRVFKRRLPALRKMLGEEEPGLVAKVEALFSKLSAWEANLNLPACALHADIHPKNVLKNAQQELWLIDFDDGHVGHRVTDWVLPALEFSFDDEGRLHEERYQELLAVLVPRRANAAELKAIPRYRSLLMLKFAVALADLGDPLDHNRYLKLLIAEDFKLPD